MQSQWIEKKQEPSLGIFMSGNANYDVIDSSYTAATRRAKFQIA